MPRVKIRAVPKPGQVPQENTLGEYIRGTDKKFKKGGSTHTKPTDDQNYPFQRDQGYMYDDYARDMGGVIVPMHAPEMDTNFYGNDGGPVNGVLKYSQGDYANVFKKGGKWLQHAVNPAHKGYCTPMTKSTCTGRRRAFAETMKKHHGFHKKDRGGVIYPFGRSEGEEKSVFDAYDRGGVIYPFGRYDGDESCINDNENMTHFFNKGGIYDQNLIGTITNPEYYPNSAHNQYKKGGNWLKGAVNPAHKGYCTPMSKSTCTGHRRAFALMMKKKHGFHKKDRGGVIYPFGRYDGDETDLWDNEYLQNFKQGGKYIDAGPNTDLNPTTNSTIADYNPYVYFKNKNWYITSNPNDDKITESVKPIDEDVANIEAEKGEYIVKPGLTGLYKITGKTHAEGGTPLYAEGGSFIFSNDPKLSFNKQERIAFGFGGGSNAKSNNTPAKVLGRQVDPQDYNSYIHTLEIPDTDRIAKTTAGLMLEKLQQKMGQVAYLQEAKKGTKPPDFAQGTAPVTSPDLRNIGEKMSEYAYGGSYPDGGGVDPVTGLPIDPRDAYPGGRTTLGRITPTGLSNTFNYTGGVPQLIQDWKRVGIDMTNMTPREAQSAMYDYTMKNNPEALRDMWKQYGNTAQGKEYGLNFNYNNLSDNELGRAGDAYADNMLGARTLRPWQPINPSQTLNREPIPQAPVNIQPPPVQTPPGIDVNKPNPTLPYQIKGKLTDSQIANLGYLGLQAFNINRYYPSRQQVALPQVRMDRVNLQPYLTQINTQAHEAYELAALNPRTSALAASNIRGTTLDQSNQAIGNVANQNVQIGNQQNLTNLQQTTQQVMANSQMNNQYFNEVQTTRQNYDNERRFANNQFMSTLNNYQGQADNLAWSLAAMSRYGTRQVTDPKTGRTYNMPTPLYEVNRNGIQFNADVANIMMASGANRINTPQEIAQVYRQFKDSGMPDVEAQRIVSAIIRSRSTRGAVNQGPYYMTNPFGMY